MMYPVYVINMRSGYDNPFIDWTAGFHYTEESAECWIKNNIEKEDQDNCEVRTLIWGLLPKHCEDAFYSKQQLPKIKAKNEAN